MNLLQNTKPKIPEDKIFFYRHLDFCKKPILKFWTTTNRKLWKLIIPISPKNKFSVTYWNANETEVLLQKQAILIFAPCNFLIFLDTSLWTENIRKDCFGIFWKWTFKFFQEKFGRQNKGGGYYKFRWNGNEGFNKIFGVRIFEKLLASKIEGKCI